MSKRAYVRRFIIEASQCELRLGDHVMPETIIGRDIKTGEIVKASCHGQVKAITFDAANHSLLVLIITNKS